MTEDNQYYLADKRDNKAYCVAKLKDGNIWMTQNLDHDIKTDGSVAYTPATTDIPSTWTPSTATYPTEITTWSSSKTTPESYDPGELYWNGEKWPTNPTSCEEAGGTWASGSCSVNLVSDSGSSHYHLGNYYNWTAAVAMNDSNIYTQQYQDINQSICPANWTLPKGGEDDSNGSFAHLISQYGWNSSSDNMSNPTIWESPIKISLGSNWTGSNIVSIGGAGIYWSSTLSTGPYANILYAFTSWTVYVDVLNSCDRGLSVRCVAR